MGIWWYRIRRMGTPIGNDSLWVCEKKGFILTMYVLISLLSIHSLLRYTSAVSLHWMPNKYASPVPVDRGLNVTTPATITLLGPLAVPLTHIQQHYPPHLCNRMDLLQPIGPLAGHRMHMQVCQCYKIQMGTTSSAAFSLQRLGENACRAR